MRHPHYVGRKAESVPSVGSRLAGVVKPSYGKPKLALASDPLKLTGDPRSFGFNSLGPNDIGAKSPYRRNCELRQLAETMKEVRKLDKFAHKTGKLVSKGKPRLIKREK